MMKERAIAIFFGAIMVASAAGYALMGLDFGNTGTTTANVSYIVNRALTTDETRSVLLAGESIIQNHYLLDCTNCSDTNTLLENTAKSMDGFVVLEEFGVQFQNETKLQIISIQGGNYQAKVTELTPPLNESFLTDTICSVSYLQPKQCLLLNIGGNGNVTF